MAPSLTGRSLTDRETLRAALLAAVESPSLTERRADIEHALSRFVEVCPAPHPLPDLDAPIPYTTDQATGAGRTVDKVAFREGFDAGRTHERLTQRASVEEHLRAVRSRREGLLHELSRNSAEEALLCDLMGKLGEG